MFLIPISRKLDYRQYKDAHFMGTVTFTPIFCEVHNHFHPEMAKQQRKKIKCLFTFKNILYNKHKYHSGNKEC